MKKYVISALIGSIVSFVMMGLATGYWELQNCLSGIIAGVGLCAYFNNDSDEVDEMQALDFAERYHTDIATGYKLASMDKMNKTLKEQQNKNDKN